MSSRTPAPWLLIGPSPQTPLPIEFHGWGAEVEVPGTGQRTVVVNIVVRPWLRAACGRQPLESSADEWGRMEVRVPDGVTHFQVFYDLPWRRGIFAGMGLAAATLAGMVLIRNGSNVLTPLLTENSRYNEGQRRTNVCHADICVIFTRFAALTI